MLREELCLSRKRVNTDGVTGNGGYQVRKDIGDCATAEIARYGEATTAV